MESSYSSFFLLYDESSKVSLIKFYRLICYHAPDEILLLTRRLIAVIRSDKNKLFLSLNARIYLMEFRCCSMSKEHVCPFQRAPGKYYITALTIIRIVS